MGVIDVHTRLRGLCNGNGRHSDGSMPMIEAARAHAEALACVDAAFVLGSTPGMIDRASIDAENEALFGVASTAARPTLFFAGIDLLERDAAERVGWWVERGAAGVVIAPADQGLRPTDDRCGRVLDAAARRDVPVIVSNPSVASGAGVLAFVDAALFDEPMSQIRGLRMLLGELGMIATDAMLTMLGRHPGLYADTSWLSGRPTALWQVLSLAHERDVLDKILFGSGLPRVTPQRAIAGLYSMQAWASRTMGQSLPREAIRAVVERDALAELRIPAELAMQSGGAGPSAGDVVVPRRVRRALPVRGWE
jgi:predicted TIM-barrel fold metal-dependent hydrolase